MSQLAENKQVFKSVMQLYMNDVVSMSVVLKILSMDPDAVMTEVENELVDHVRRMGRYEIAKSA